MKLRVARHTENIEAITHFYCSILGLEILGQFKDHDHYDGIFIGLKENNWHLEFTISNKKPSHHADADDLLVFYINREEFDILKEAFKRNNILEVEPKNPYWKYNGITYEDPDGYRIVISTNQSK